MATADTTEVFLSYLGANVRRARLRRGLTQAELAERAEIDVRYVQRVERGTVNLRFHSFVRLATALDVPPGQLLRRVKVAPAKVGRPRKKK